MSGGMTGGMKYQKPTKKFSKFQQWLMSRGKSVEQQGVESDEFQDTTPGFAQFYYEQTGVDICRAPAGALQISTKNIKIQELKQLVEQLKRRIKELEAK